MSSTAKHTVLRELFEKSVRSAAMHTYSSAHLPEADVQQPEVSQVYRVGDMKELQLDRDNLQSTAKEILSRTECGVIGKLSAGTGVGKSTKVPIKFALQLGSVVVVVNPKQVMAECVSEYLNSAAFSANELKVTVAAVSCLERFKCIAAPAVVYMGATEFWFMLYENRDVLRERNVAVVCFDESHERIPQYLFASFMVTTDIFSSTKTFMMSATASADKLESRPNGIRHDVHGVKEELMDHESMSSLTTRSPLHYSRAVKPFMVFLPNDEVIDDVAKYYESNGVLVYKLYSDTSARKFQAINNVLGTTRCAMVLLLTPAHETFYTFNMDGVVDCGVSEGFEIDDDTGAVTLPMESVTMSQRIQRCGRVGRFKSGSAWFKDVDSASEDFELQHRGSMYLALWAKLFNVKLMLPWLKKWDNVVTRLSPTCVRILLAAKIHPWLMINYLTPQGKLLSGMKPLLGYVLDDFRAVKSSGATLCDTDKDMWLDRTMGIKRNFGALSLEYKVPVDLPVQWAVIGYVFYQALMGYRVSDMLDSGVMTFRGKSVVSYTSTVRSVLSESECDVASVAGSTRVRRTGNRSAVRRSFGDVLSPHDSVSVVGELENKIKPLTVSGSNLADDSLPGYYSSASSLGNVAVESKVKLRNGKSVERVRRADSGVAMGVRELYGKVIGSGGSVVYGGAKCTVVSTKLRIVSAADMRDIRVRPFNDSLMRSFVRMRLEDRPITLYRDLKACNVEVATMPLSEMRDCFVAVVCVWNRKVSNKLQHDAAPFTGMFSDYRNDAYLDKLNKSLRRCRGFLQTFEHHGFVLAELVGLEQCGFDLPDMASLSGVYAAAWVLSAGTDVLRRRVAVVSYAIGRFVRSDGKTGCYVVSGDRLMTTRHVVCDDREGLSLELPRHDVSAVRVAELVQLTLTVTSAASLYMRAPKLDEFVIVVSKDMAGAVHTFGVYKVLMTGVLCEYSADLFEGASGSVVMAVDDGALIGFHHGVLANAGEVVVSTFAPVF